MSTRAATATIKGYFYQFDTTILQFLELPNDSDVLTIEGIEDIGIKTATEESAIQCKYLSKPNYTNSSVREAIILMLDHCIKYPNRGITYYLYAHYENEKGGSEKVIDLNTLKDILTYKVNKVSKQYHIDNRIADKSLEGFLSKFKLIFGKKFETQQEEVIKKLKRQFNCSPTEADCVLYNNALRVVMERAKEKDISKRTLNKGTFLRLINVKKQLFNEWYITLRGKKEYLQMERNYYTESKANIPSRSKYIFIGKDVLQGDNTKLPIGRFIENLVGKYYAMNTAMSNAKPITFVLDCPTADLQNVKKDLLSNEIWFNDGHEEIQFNTAAFNMGPIINTTRNAAKIQNSSYLVKIVSAETFKKYQADITVPKVVCHFSNKDISYIGDSSSQIFDVKYCENLHDINSILN